MLRQNGLYNTAYLITISFSCMIGSGCRFAAQRHDLAAHKDHKHVHCNSRSSSSTGAAVTVSGLAKTEGRFDFSDGMALWEAIEEAGGIFSQRPFADSENGVLISLVRDDETHHFSYALVKQDPLLQGLPLQPGDGIVVQEWLQTDLAKGRKLVRRKYSEPISGANALWIFEQAQEAVDQGFCLDSIETFRKNYEAEAKQNNWTKAAEAVRKAALCAVRMRGDRPILASPRKVENAADAEAFAKDLADSFRTFPIRTYIQADLDLAYLRHYYQSRMQDVTTKFRVPFVFRDGGVYPIVGVTAQANLNENNPQYPTLGELARKQNTDENAIVILERDVNGRSHIFIFRVYRIVPLGQGAAYDLERESLEGILLFPGDEVTVTQTGTLPIVLEGTLRPLLERLSPQRRSLALFRR